MGPEFIEIVMGDDSRMYINVNYIVRFVYDRYANRTSIHISGVERPLSVDGNKTGSILRQIEDMKKGE